MPQHARGRLCQRHHGQPRGLDGVGHLVGTLEQVHATRLRRGGRQCRGLGHGFVTLGRPTATPGLARGPPVLARARAAPVGRHGAPPRAEDPQARRETQRTAALQAPHRSAHPSRRLTPGTALPHGQSVQADEPPMAPRGHGQRPGPAPLGRTPGLMAEPAAGWIVALQRPVGPPRAASAGEPRLGTGAPAMARVGTRPAPALHARAGALALTDAARREAVPARGLRTVGRPRTVAPLPPSPTPEDVVRILDEADWHHSRTPSQVHRA
jgi:hypothetical protein